MSSRKSLGRRVWQSLRHSPAGGLGLLITILVVATAIAGPWVTPYDPTAADFGAVLQAPSAAHLMGTDQLGRDILTRIIYGARISLLIGVVTVAVGGVFGTLIGVVSGYFGGWLNTVIMRIVDVQLSFPFILLALTINAIIGIGLRNILISLTLAGWVIYARVARGETAKVRAFDFVEAARATGVSHVRIMFKHILPALFTPLIVVSTLQIAQFIVAEAAISFLGFGVQPPTAAWGSMMSDGRDYLYVFPWLVTFPGLALMVTALGINLLGDWLRDMLDPTLET